MVCGKDKSAKLRIGVGNKVFQNAKYFVYLEITMTKDGQNKVEAGLKRNMSPTKRF